ncbi:MAG: ATP-binding protein [Nitrospirae bacterium]|nr:ATP-binding protein [Nitrospirota bacterium]
MNNETKFIDRVKEIASLEEEYRKKGAGLLVLYGRRRVGKTTLIEEFIKGKKVIYFMADKQVERDLQRRLQLSMARSLKDPLMEKIDFASWDDLFEYWLSREPFSKKIVLVLDEFQYLAKVNPAFPSILQRVWDQKLKDRNIFLILCGSLINMMYASTLSYESPLYGRRTGQIKLDPLSFGDCAGFFPKLPPLKRLEFYTVTGGTPRYIETLSPDKTVWENIRRGILSKRSYLYGEPKFILNEEVTETLNYFSILKTVAEGEHKIGNIAAKLGIKANILTKYLDMLINLDILERQVPVTEDRPEKSKMGLYFIKDHFFRFWFRYVFPNQSDLEIEKADDVLDKIKEDFASFVGLVYEKVCLDHIPLLAGKGILPFTPEKWGRWWTRSEEIDVVAWNAGTKEILFGECKWSDRPVGIDVLKSLEKKSQQVPWQRDGRKEYFVLFAKKGFTQDLKKAALKRNIVLVQGV